MAESPNELRTTDDQTLSPWTGYTRAHWVEIVERLVRGVLPYVDRATGVVRLVGDPGETALRRQLRNPGGLSEMFDRTHLLMAVYIRATGRTTVDGYDGDIAELYRRGMKSFHCPASPHYDWRRGAAATSLAMLLAPEAFIDPLDDELRAGLTEHLPKYVTRPAGRNNTMLFNVMPAAVMERLGIAYDRARLEDHLDEIITMYRGDGWFIDGWNAGFDNYNFWAFQLYLHAVAAYDERWRAIFGERIREITLAHERTLPCYFGRDGGPIPKGRSINYRFAVLSGLGYSRLSGLAGMRPGLARRISSGVLRHFWDHDCLSERDLLEPGYRGANSAVGEDYTDYGAPYWASTGLVALALPPDDPFWTVPEEPMPADGDTVSRCPVLGAEMILKSDGRRGGEARQMVVGEPFLHRRIWQAGSKYFQHAYSSTLGYALAGDLGPELGAGRTGLSDDGSRWAWRTRPRLVSINAERGRSEWDAWESVGDMTGSVITESVMLDEGELHVFWHTCPDPRHLAIGGWSIQLEGDERVEMGAVESGLLIGSCGMWSILKVVAPKAAKGCFATDEVRPREGFRHSHLFGGWAAYPRWSTLAAVEAGVKIVAFVDAARRVDAPEPGDPPIRISRRSNALTVEIRGRKVRF